MSKTIKIGNAHAFWGDRTSAAARLAQHAPDLDVITLDYLAELTMSILAIQKEKDPHAGYAKDFIDVITSLAPFWKAKRPLKVITNAGGLNTRNCALACQDTLRHLGITHIKIGVVTGDEITDTISNDHNHRYTNLDTGKAFETIASRLITANTYLGSKPIVDALNRGADIVITGRVADPCLTAAPCIAHHRWAWDDFDKIAAATIAGHLIECGTQVTGGISTHWNDIPSMTEPGSPIVEVDEDGTFIVTKTPNSDGTITIETVKEQLLYEIQDPDSYLSPDVTASLLSLQLHEEGKDRIRLTGAKGRPPPDKYKVSATYHDGYQVEGMIALYGRDAREKGYRCGEIVKQRLHNMGYDLDAFHVECIGSGDIVPGIAQSDTTEVMIRIAARDQRKEALEALAKEVAPLVTSGPQGITGYASGRPKVRPRYSFWPTFIAPENVKTTIEILEV